MADPCTSQPFAVASGATIAGLPDFIQEFQQSSSFWDVANQTYVTARNAALVPIMVNENIRTSGTYISSSQSRLQQAQSGFLQQLQSGTKIQQLGPLQSILSNVTGIVNNVGNTSSNTVVTSSTAVASGTAFASGVSTFYIDFAPFSKVVFWHYSTLDSSVQVTATGAVDGSFNPEHSLGSVAANNPVTVAAGGPGNAKEKIQTLTDPFPLVRLKYLVNSNPTQGNLSSYAMLRV